jgi:hypothetical protein
MGPPRPPLQPPAVALEPRATVKLQPDVDIDLGLQRHVRWHREGRLHAGQSFMCSWTWHGEPSGSINVRTELDAVVLTYRARSRGATEWKSIEQRVPLTWTPCHFGGRRPWFVCSVYSNGRYCGRRAAVLYGAGELYACRHCYGLAYESQQQSSMCRGLSMAQKILSDWEASVWTYLTCFRANRKACTGQLIIAYSSLTKPQENA